MSSNSNKTSDGLVTFLFIFLNIVFFLFFFLYKIIKRIYYAYKEKKLNELEIIRLQEEEAIERQKKEEYNRIKKEIEENINKKIQDVQSELSYYNREQALDYINIKESL